MGTATSPEVYVQYYDDSVTTPVWRQLESKAASFTVNDGGLLRIPDAQVMFVNPTHTPNQHDVLKITVNCRGVNDVIFYGLVEELESLPIVGTESEWKLRLHAYGLERILKNDTITWNYATEQASHGSLWTYKSMIEDFLNLADSGYSTGFVFDTDTGDILNYVEGQCDFKRQTLLDSFRIVGEQIGYDGYVWLDGSTAKIKFVPLGSLFASPDTYIDDPFVGQPKQTLSIEEVKNYILVWGGVDKGYPWDGDRFTERGMAKYNPDVWEPLGGETITDTLSDPADLTSYNTVTTASWGSLTDTSKSWSDDQWMGYSAYIYSGTGHGQLRQIYSNTSNKISVTPNWSEVPDNTSKYQIFMGYNPTKDNVASQQLSRYAVRVSKASGIIRTRFRIDLSGKPSLDLQNRYTTINFAIFGRATITSHLRLGMWIGLEDVNGDVVIRFENFADLSLGLNFIWSRLPEWTEINLDTFPNGTLDISDDDSADWQYYGGSTTFDPTQVRYIDIACNTPDYQDSFVIDRFFIGGGLKIDPFQNPSLYPAPADNGAILDATSISDYGLKLYHHNDRDITSFENAVMEGQRVLAGLKNQVKTIECCKHGYTWLRPNQNVVVRPTTLGTGNEIWRVKELRWDWNSISKIVYCNMRLVERYAEVTPVFGAGGDVPANETSTPMYGGGGGRSGGYGSSGGW